MKKCVLFKVAFVPKKVKKYNISKVTFFVCPEKDGFVYTTFANEVDDLLPVFEIRQYFTHSVFKAPFPHMLK